MCNCCSMKKLVIYNSLLTTNQLMNDLTAFYKSQAISQAYVFLFGLDILGNPLGLVKDVRHSLGGIFSVSLPAASTPDN